MTTIDENLSKLLNKWKDYKNFKMKSSQRKCQMTNSITRFGHLIKPLCKSNKTSIKVRICRKLWIEILTKVNKKFIRYSKKTQLVFKNYRWYFLYSGKKNDRKSYVPRSGSLGQTKRTIRPRSWGPLSWGRGSLLRWSVKIGNSFSIRNMISWYRNRTLEFRNLSIGRRRFYRRFEINQTTLWWL